MTEATPTELAKILRVSREAIYKAERTGRIHRQPNGKFDVLQAMTDWIENTDPFWGGKRTPSSDTRQTPQVVNNEFIEFWLLLFHHSAGPLAIELAKRTSLSPKEVWNILGFNLLLQWFIVFEILDISEDSLIDLYGAAKTLSTHEGQQFLENWLREKVKSLKK